MHTGPPAPATPPKHAQILALFAMEQPVSLDAEDIRNEKVKVRRRRRRALLPAAPAGRAAPRRAPNPTGAAAAAAARRAPTPRLNPSPDSTPPSAPTPFNALQHPPPPAQVLRSMKVVGPEDVVVGQYRAKGKLPGYLDDDTVPKGSLTPTFAAVAMFSARRGPRGAGGGGAAPRVALFACAQATVSHPAPAAAAHRPPPPPAPLRSRQRALGRRALPAQGRQGAPQALRGDPRAVQARAEGGGRAGLGAGAGAGAARAAPALAGFCVRRALACSWCGQLRAGARTVPRRPPTRPPRAQARARQPVPLQAGQQPGRLHQRARHPHPAAGGDLPENQQQGARTGPGGGGLRGPPAGGLAGLRGRRAQGPRARRVR